MQVSSTTAPSEPVLPESSTPVPPGASEGSPPSIPPAETRPGWYRPPDSKARKWFEKIAIMRAAGHHDDAIAKRLDTTVQSVRQYVYLAKKNGWTDDDGEPIDLEAELALNIDRKIVRNIGQSLDGYLLPQQTHEMTIAGAKGRGIFKNHEKVEGDGSQVLPVVAIQVVMPPIGTRDQIVDEQAMGGTPAYLDAEVEVGA